MYGKRTIVFSRTMTDPKHPKVEVVADDPAGVVSRLKAEPGKDIWLFGGGNLFRQFLDAGLVDTVEVAIVPVMLGSGIPLLPAGARASLTLTGHQLYSKTGTVLLEYAVKY